MIIFNYIMLSKIYGNLYIFIRIRLLNCVGFNFSILPLNYQHNKSNKITNNEPTGSVMSIQNNETKDSPQKPIIKLSQLKFKI